MTSSQIKNFVWDWFDIDSFGHTVQRHIEMPNEYLKGRSERFHKSFVSSFDSVKMAYLYEKVLDAICEDAHEVSDWMNDLNDLGVWGIYTDIPKGITGRQYVKSEDKVYTCEKMLIVLKKTKSITRFKISTVYPYSKDHEPVIM